MIEVRVSVIEEGEVLLVVFLELSSIVCDSGCGDGNVRWKRWKRFQGEIWECHFEKCLNRCLCVRRIAGSFET